MGWLLWLALAAASPPSDATVVYYNARLAMRDGHPRDAVRHWFLRNALESKTHQVSSADADFRSLAWAALGELGLCPDGLDRDGDGVGLWPVALHNQVVANLGRGKPPKPLRAFDAFEVGRQQRLVAITDVLDVAELRTLQLGRGRCFAARRANLEAGGTLLEKLGDRQVAARLMRALLVKARESLAAGRVRGRSAIEARIFDLDLQIAELAAREARAEARDAARRARDLGMSRPAVTAMNAEAPTTTLDPASPAAAILRDCLEWPTSEWLQLAPDRRLYLFARARTQASDPAAFDQLGLRIVDALIADGQGRDLPAWIGLLTAGNEGVRREIWDGARGRALLALDDEAGFRERAPIALLRGIDELSRGELHPALRSIAYAREHAGESVAVAELEGLSLRWLSYVASRFEVSAELLVTLQALVPRRDYALLLEDLMWSAAFHADLRSFDLGVAHQLGRGALERRLGLLRPLAAGDAARFVSGIERGLAESPGETGRFLDQFVERLEVEDAGVRATQLGTMAALRRVLAPRAEATEGREARAAAALSARIQAISDGLGAVEPGLRERARTLSPGGEVYAGSVRLAPSDPVPWPFRADDPSAPSVFAPLLLRPVEWRDAAGAWVFGWSISG